MVLVDAERRPLTPFVNWQDQRGNEPVRTGDESWVEQARRRLGDDVFRRTGCKPNTGFMATTLFWMQENHCLPSNGRACFIMDLLAAELTGETPGSDPSCGGSAGVLNVAERCWDTDAIAALGLSVELFPRVLEADRPLGTLQDSIAKQTGLPVGTPVSVPIGDHQASFLGSVSNRHVSVLLNVGTGAQVAVFTPECQFEAPIELRPFPISGNLLSNVGLAGGWSFQIIEQFFRQVGHDVLELNGLSPAYEKLTELAGQSPSGADGLVCMPTFTGTRSDPTQRGTIAGISASNLTPANLARAVLEGMAANYRTAWDQIVAVTKSRSTTLIGAGNGLRENRVLAAVVRDAFGLTPLTTQHREEAAFGAALIAGVATGLFSDLDEAGRLIAHASTTTTPRPIRRELFDR